jgi:hypothetical protein
VSDGDVPAVLPLLNVLPSIWCNAPPLSYPLFCMHAKSKSCSRIAGELLGIVVGPPVPLLVPVPYVFPVGPEL